MAQTLQTGQYLLKRLYIGPIREQLNNMILGYKILTRNIEDVSGEDLVARVPLHTTRNSGIGARDVLADLPTAGNQGGVQMQVPTRYNYARILLAGQIFNASRTSKTAFERALTTETEGAMRDLKNHLAKMVFGDGSGALGRINQASGSVTAGSTIAIDEPGVIWLEVGQRIQAFSAKSGGTQGFGGQTVTVASVDRRANTITLQETVTITNNDFLFLEGERGSQIMGLRGIVDSNSAGTTYVTTLQGIDRSVAGNSFWNANVLDNPLGIGGTNRPLTLDLIQDAFEQAEIVGGEVCDCIISSHRDRRRYLDLLQQDRRFTPDMKLKGGFKTLEYYGGGSGVDWYADRYCPEGEIYFLSKKFIQRYIAADFDWMDKDGAVLNRVSNKDAYEATLFNYDNLGVSKCNAQTVLRDVA